MHPIPSAMGHGACQNLPTSRSWRFRTQENLHAAQVGHTLPTMGNSEAYDRLGGEFARYCFDEIWLMPHFQAMLYVKRPAPAIDGVCAKSARESSVC